MLRRFAEYVLWLAAWAFTVGVWFTLLLLIGALAS
jgi:hypothetical protein